MTSSLSATQWRWHHLKCAIEGRGYWPCTGISLPGLWSRELRQIVHDIVYYTLYMHCVDADDACANGQESTGVDRRRDQHFLQCSRSGGKSTSTSLKCLYATSTECVLFILTRSSLHSWLLQSSVGRWLTGKIDLLLFQNCCIQHCVFSVQLCSFDSQIIPFSGVSRLGELAGPQGGPGVCSNTGP